MYCLVCFIPRSHLEEVKEAMFKAGAGKLGNYDRCCFEVYGSGQFRPLKGSQAFLGSVDQLERVEEARIELMCEDGLVESVLEAMKKSHPYEEPAFYVLKNAQI